MIDHDELPEMHASEYPVHLLDVIFGIDCEGPLDHVGPQIHQFRRVLYRDGSDVFIFAGV